MNTTQTMNGSTTPLERARALFQEGDLDGSEKVLTELVTSGVNTGEGLYGLGVIRLAQGNLEAATSHFSQSLQLDPQNANAMYQLGVIAERRSSSEEAQALYARALAANPNHRGAAARIAQIKRLPPYAPIAPPAAPAVHSEASPLQQFGVYEFLRRDASVLSQQTLQLIDALRMSVRPSISASLGSLLPSAAAFVLIALLGAASASAAALPLMLIAAAAFTWKLLSISTTKITIDKGRVQVERGLFSRTTDNIELWRVQDIDLYRSPLNRITGDGVLVFNIPNQGTPTRQKLELAGIAQGERLQEVYQQLLNFVFVLRSNPIVKGIIAY
jgi:membrane protein YdbS with pleckstrin-like domain